MNHAMKSMRAQVLAQFCRLRDRTNYPVAGNFRFKVIRQNLPYSSVGSFWREAGPRDSVSWPGIAGENPGDVFVIVQLDPRQGSSLTD
jgi:hypothetical protein